MRCRAADYEGQQDKAIALLKQAVAIDSDFAMASRALGGCAANVGQRDSYRGIHRRDQASGPPHRARAVLHSGRLLPHRHSDFARAAPAYEALLEQHPNEREALNNLALTYNVLGRPLQAESLYQRSIGLDSLYMPAHFNLIVLQLALKRWTEAEASYARATRQLPDMAWIRPPGVWLAEQKGDSPWPRPEPVRSTRDSDPTRLARLRAP